MKIWRAKDEKLGGWIWKADFRYKKKRFRPQAKQKSDLEELINAIRSNADRSEIGLETKAPKVTLQELFDEHIKGFDLTMKTHRRGKVILETFLSKVGKDKAVERIESPDIRNFILWRKEQSDLKPESVNKEVGYISSMLRHAPDYFKSLKKYVPPRMPWEPAPKNSSQRVIYKDEREKLLAYLGFDGLHPNEKPSSRLARFEYADMFELAYNAVLRWGEVAPLEWAMFDWQRSRLTLPPEITKTKEGRYAYLNSRAFEILNRRRQTATSKYIFPGSEPDSYRKYYYEGIRRIAKKLGLPFGRDVGFVLHSLKHSALTTLIENTGDMAAAQAAGAHARQTMTLKYTHTTHKRIAAAMESLVDED